MHLGQLLVTLLVSGVWGSINNQPDDVLLGIDIAALPQAPKKPIRSTAPFTGQPNYSVSPEDVRLDVNPDQLECANFHRYCSLNNRNDTCSCGKDCVTLGSCCWDSPIDVDSDPVYSCIKVRVLAGYEPYSMISRCPRDWVIEDVRQKCELPYNTNSEDVFMWIPVSNNETNSTYRNVFCAACHADRKVQPWRLGFSCADEIDQENVTRDPLQCRRVAVRPSHLTVPELCTEEVEDCDMFWMNYGLGAKKKSWAQELRRKCWTYSAPVYHINEPVVFKNKFCALCSGAKVDGLQCAERTRKFGYGVMARPPNSPPRVIPFSLLMDIDFTNGDQVGSRCSDGNAFDPVQQRCRSIWCGDSLKYVDGACVQVTNSSGHVYELTNPIRPNRSCTPRKVYASRQDSSLFWQSSTDDNYTDFDNETVLCPEDDVMQERMFDEMHSLLTLVCIGISLTCLLVKMVLYLLTPEERTKTAPRAIFCLSGTLFVAELCFLAGAARVEWGAGCVAIAMVTHYSFLSSFHWTNVLAFDIWRTFSVMSGPSPSASGVKANKKFIRYALYSWLTPLTILGIAALFEWALPVGVWRPEYGQRGACWLGSRRGLVLFFALPLACLLLLNFVFFAGTAFQICRAVQASRFARQNTRKDCIRFGLYIKLALIMGLTWAFGFVAPFSRGQVMWYVFTIFNGLQGAFILLAFTQFGRLWKGLRSSLSVKTESSQSGRTGTSQDPKTSNGTTNLTRSTAVHNSSLNVTSHL